MKGPEATEAAAASASSAAQMEVETAPAAASGQEDTSLPVVGQDKRERSDSMEQTAMEEELVRTNEPSVSELKLLSSLCATPYLCVLDAMRCDDTINLLQSSGVCLDVRGDERVKTELGRDAILAEIHDYKYKLVVAPYMEGMPEEFVSDVAKRQSSDGGKFAVCLLDDDVLPIDRLASHRQVQFPGSRVIHNFEVAGNEVLSHELSTKACATARAVESLLESVAIPANTGRKNLHDQKDPNEIHSMVFGAYTSYGLGVSSNGFKRHELLGLLHELASERPRDAAPYSTIN
eukprot:1688694-Amphidinium_carterae.1